jgi:hypothetical protein
MRHASVLCAVLTGCVLDLPDAPGLQCDAQHLCELGRTCVAGTCQPTGATWRQAVDGFAGMTVLPGATLVLGAGNAVTATVPNASDAHDRATGDVSMPLPMSGNGHLKGTLRLPAPLSLSAESAWLWLGSETQLLLSLAFDASGALVCRSDPGALSPQALAATAVQPGGFVANEDFTLEVTWKRGEFRRVFVNGTELTNEGLTAPGGTPVEPTQLRLGIDRYDGTATTGWGITLSDWQLADDPETPL